ncbi:aspartic proteinase nepenthesin-1-like [Pistacia vera]|uniref:aspartic proteinase nepenthesin-1-like n=1 Tax=Pistacia vera TaxID=55513 RepID=UPI0012637874|nr:aspartic proteinase nepenthesin-1-like [Pistacia vera]
MVGLQFFVVLVLQSLVVFSRHTFGFAETKSNGVSIKLIPIDSRESPLYKPNLTRRQKIERMVNVTLAKAKLRNLRSTQNSTFDDDKHLFALDRQDKFYLAQMLIGNPIQYVYVVVDTGGPLTWTQCAPCTECFHQIYPIYDRRHSSTYRRLSCNHRLCNHDEEGSLFQCVNGRCVYTHTYGTGGEIMGPTKGYASLESFHFLVNTNGDTEQFTILFGCSNDNVNFEFADDEDNKISGIMGLDLHPNSLASQLSNVFSYCIVPYDDDFPFDVHAHILRFGADVYFPPYPIPTTQYVSVAGTNSYYLRLLDISVGRSRLNFPRGTFEPSSSGVFIDSGTPFTTLTTRAANRINVFERVNRAFWRYYDSRNLVRYPTEPDDSFHVCYMIPQNFRDYPSMTFHFRGADYEVDGRFVNIRFDDEGHFCVAIMPEETDSILGAYYMQNMRIIHNGGIGAVQFFQAQCAGDHF